jgi:hypothetical protein
MAFNVNDLKSRAYSVAVADDDGVVSGACRVFGMGCTPGTGDLTLSINNAVTKAGGGTTITLNTDISTTDLPVSFDFTPNGIRFDTGLSVTVTDAGSGGTVWVTYIAE